MHFIFRYDFFLVSQHVGQGTVTPTHYIVVYDTAQMKVDHLQELTYKMTHMYYNWPGTVRVPAPCQVHNKFNFFVNPFILCFSCQPKYLYKYIYLNKSVYLNEHLHK